MTRLVDADEKGLLMELFTYRRYTGIDEAPIETAIDVIHKAPTIDAVEVVRCGRCEWWKCNPNTEEYGVCKKVSYDDFEVVMNSDDFCSYGERREDGEA